MFPTDLTGLDNMLQQSMDFPECENCEACLLFFSTPPSFLPLYSLNSALPATTMKRLAVSPDSTIPGLQKDLQVQFQTSFNS